MICDKLEHDDLRATDVKISKKSLIPSVKLPLANLKSISYYPLGTMTRYWTAPTKYTLLPD
jgi:hypothetical protein